MVKPPAHSHVLIFRTPLAQRFLEKFDVQLRSAGGQPPPVLIISGIYREIESEENQSVIDAEKNRCAAAL